MIVNLDKQEVTLAEFVGRWRHKDSKNLVDQRISTRLSSAQIDIDGAAAELAFAKLTNLYWQAGVGTFKKPDVGDIQVRSTRYLSGHLIIKANDHLEYIYALMVGTAPRYEFRGWMLGVDAKTPQFYRAEANSWWVPQKFLNKELPCINSG